MRHSRPWSAFFLAILALAVSTGAHAQTASGDFSLSSGAVYQTTAVADEARSVAVDTISVGGPYIYVTGDNGTTGATVKLSSAGVALTSASFINGGTGTGRGVRVDNGGNVWVAGYSETGGGTVANWVVQKYDSSLLLLSSSVINGVGLGAPIATSIVLDSSGNAFVAGYSSNTGTGSDYQVIKYSPSLVVLASATLGGGSIEQAHAMAVDASGNVILTGDLVSGGYDWWTVKFNSSLVMISSAVFDGGGTDRAYGVTTDPSGNIYVVGESNNDLKIIKYNTSLGQTGTVGFSSGGYDAGNAAMFVGASTLVVVGVSNAGPNDDWLIFEYDSSLALISSRAFDGGNSDRAFAVAKGTGSYMYAAGWSGAPADIAFRTIRMNVTGAGAGALAPVAPSAFTGVAQSSTSILWSWTDASSDETGFRVKLGPANLSGDLAANATTWLQTGLSANVSTGALLVQAFNTAGAADSSASTRYTLTEPPNSITATFFGSSVAFTWPAMTNPANTLWSVERGTDGVSFASQLYFSSAAAAYTNTGLSAATTYYYRVGSANQNGVMSYHANSSAIVYTGGAQPPAAPSDFSGVAQTTASILWTWTDNSSDESGFRIMAGAANVSGSLTANTTSWLQTGLDVNASSGSLFVQAFNSTGTANSSAATRYSLAATPGTLSAAGVGLGAASLSWLSGGNSAGTLFELERSTGTGFGLRQSSASYTFADPVLAPASTYYYRVRTRNADGLAAAYTSTIAVVSLPMPVYPAPASISISSAEAGSSVAAAVTGTSFTASAVLTFERAAPDAETWISTSSFTQARHSSTLIKLRDGRALLVGGLVEGTTAGRPEVNLFNLASGIWTAAAPLKTGRFQHADVMLSDGRVLVTGGQAPDASVVASAEIYDPASSTWTTVASMSQIRKGHRMALLPDGRVLAVGGYDGVVSLLTAEIYDPAFNTWSAAASMSVVRAYPTLTVLGNGKVLVAGGRDPTLTTASAQLYDHLLNTWTPTNPMSVSRSDHEAVLLPDGRVLIAGGLDAGGEANTADLYDPLSSSWTATGLMAAKRRSLSLVLVTGAAMAIGGQDAATDYASTDLYSATANAWVAGPSLTNTRTIAAAIALDDGRALVAGGRRGLGGGTTLNTAERLGGAGASVTATGVNVPDSQHVNGTVSLAAAATGYWDVVVREPGGRVGRLNGGFRVLVLSTPAAPSGFAGAAQSTTAILWSWTDGSSNESGFRVMAGAVNVSGDLAANTTSWLQTGLGVNTSSGALLARAFNAAGTTDTLAASRYSLAEVPTVLASSGVYQTSATVIWTAGNPAGTVFELERSTGTGFALVSASSLAAAYADSGLASPATYYYRVRARNADGVATVYASSITVVTLPPPNPLAPTGFSGAAQSTGVILWSWTDNASNETGFRVVAGTVSVSGDLAANATFWLQPGLTANAAYGPYAAQAFNAGGSTDSATAARTTFADAPSTLAAAGVYQTSGTLSWNAGVNPAGTTFDLERSTGTAYGLQFTGPATYYFDQYLTPGTTNTFRVRARNAEGVATAYAATLAVPTVAAPPVPGPAGTPVGTALGTSSASWTWVLAAGATNHFLFRASDVSYLGSSSSGPYVQTALSPNTAYGMRAAGVNLGGTGPLSPSGTAYTLAALPSGGAVGTIASTSVVVTWGLNGNPASTVAQLQRSTDAVAYAALASGAVTSYADADLLGCTTYYYRVRNLNGDGLPTGYSSFTGVTANTTPGPPAGLTASANAGGTVSLNWSLSPTEGVTGYRLYWDSGSGTVSYGAAIAVLASTQTSWTSGVLTSSASYTFALRAAHRCGVVETAGALAMSGAAVAPPPVRAVIKEPDSGRRISGNSITILGELISGSPGDVQQVLFQYKLASSTAWLNVSAANINSPNGDFSFPYFTHVNAAILASGDYDLRAVAYDRNGVPDSAPPAVRVAVDPVAPDIRESLTVEGKIQKEQTVSNSVTSTIETAGAGAADPAVRVSLPPGAVTAATATLSVIANPTITTAAPRGQSFVGSAIKIDLSNGQTALNGTAAITLTYPENVRFPSLLQIFYLNEATGQWSRDFATTVDTASRTVTGLTPHFSTFALMLGTAFASDLNSVQVYPVPFKSNGPNPDEGRPFTTGDANSGIIFANLAAGADIEIYTLSGRLVSSIGNPSIAGTVRWDVRNQDGRDVASGAYFAVIKAPGHKAVVKKLVVIR